MRWNFHMALPFFDEKPNLINMTDSGRQMFLVRELRNIKVTNEFHWQLDYNPRVVKLFGM